jgi:hypothetical protein
MAVILATIGKQETETAITYTFIEPSKPGYSVVIHKESEFRLEIRAPWAMLEDPLTQTGPLSWQDYIADLEAGNIVTGLV